MQLIGQQTIVNVTGTRASLKENKKKERARARGTTKDFIIPWIHVAHARQFSDSRMLMHA